MIPSSYKPIEGESPPESPAKQSRHQRLFQRIKDIDRSFIISKLFYFFFYTALGALFPFFSLYYKQLWLSPSQIGILLALRPTVKLICLPLWKMITDKYSKPRAVYFISIFGWLIGYYGQTFVSPDNISCYVQTSHGLMPSVQPNHSLSLNASLNVPKHDWNLMDSNLNSASSYTKNIFLNFQQGKRLFKRDIYHLRKMSFKTQTDKSTYLTPSHLKEQAVAKQIKSDKDKSLKQKHKNKFLQNLDRTYDNKRESINRQTSDFPHNNGQVSNNLEENNSKNQPRTTDIDSEDNDVPRERKESIEFVNSVKNDNMEKMAAFNDNPSKSPKPDDDFRIRYNYWIIRTLAVLIILTEIITAPTPMLADSAVLQSIADTDNEYGKQRLFGSFGLALAAALVAVWVSFSSLCPYTDTINYIPCFNIFIIAIGATIFVSLFFKFEAPTQDPVEYKVLEAFKIFKLPRYGLFLFTMFALGFAHSLQIGFLFWYLQDIGGTPVLFALMILVYCVSEVVMYFLMGYIIDAIGKQKTLVIAISCYALRFLMYAYLKYPWLVIPMELVQGMTYGGVWSVAGIYIKAPEGAGKIIQSILHGAYWGVGMAIGAISCGFIIEACGAPRLFLGMSLAMAVLCLVHLFVSLGDRIEELNQEERERRGLQRAGTSSKKKGEQQENFIGAAAAPMVPCLLYGN